QFEKANLAKEVERFGMPGYAPTQGHIPSGVPFVGFAREMLMDGRINKAMIVGKGSLFLGRLTNLFDGVSFIMEKNSGAVASGFDQEQVRQMIAEAMRELAQKIKGE
ncbi:MAG: glycine reductase, partial [Clostridia bacterium]|nr:glycine reductase [Clostridia bacterium]